VLDFVSAMENCSMRDTALKLQNPFIVVPILPPPRCRSDPSPDTTPNRIGGEINKPLSSSLRKIDLSHLYLAGRGIEAETAHHFGVGYNRGAGSMAGRIVIPIHDENGLLLAYAGRAVDGTEPKYRFPARFQTSLALFHSISIVPWQPERASWLSKDFWIASRCAGSGRAGAPLGEAKESIPSKPQHKANQPGCKPLDFQGLDESRRDSIGQ
jgi:DNA primase catalytic core, N-terminal domain